MKKVFISGMMGNMGRRYAQIAKYLGWEVCGSDNTKSFLEQAAYCKRAGISRIIVATPTATHLDAINIFGSVCDVPLLVEKPIVKGKLRSPDFHITMVNQYAYLYDPESVGPTKYDYFKTGSDGFMWDCVNIIGLATGDVTIKNISPVWTCQINGKEINIKDMDTAYIKMMDAWLTKTEPNIEYYTQAHNKVWKMIQDGEKKDHGNVVTSDTKVIPILGGPDD